MKKFKRMTFTAALSLVVAATGNALAQPTIDGNASVADGYTLLSTQNTNTQFGNATLPDLIASGGGSELDQVFGKIENGRLYMVLAGNLETNFNKMHVFIDSVAGGVNQIDGDEFTPDDNNVPFGFDSFCCGGFQPPNGSNTDNLGALQKMDTFKFDTEVEADYALVFSHGRETVGAGAPIDPINFYAVNAHFAELKKNGNVVAAGIQLGPQGNNRVMRMSPADFVNDFDVDGEDFLRWQNNFGTVGTPDANDNDVVAQQNGNANSDTTVDGVDLAIWKARYGTDRLITDQSFSPFFGGPQTSDLLFGAPLPGLGQGELIDKNYALGADGGCSADATDGGGGCAVPELEFVLPVDSNDTGNTLNHRNFDNSTLGLQLAVDNSNNAGVSGDGGLNSYADPTTDDPGNVTTGIEFSIGLDKIGNPAALSDLKIVAFVNSNGFDFSANQYAGDGVLQGNLANFAAGIDLSTIAGNQFVTLQVPAATAIGSVPEPTSALLLVLGALGVATRRRS